MDDVTTIPAAVAGAYLALTETSSTRPESFEGFGRQLGTTVEVDIGALSDAGFGGLAGEFIEWFRTCRAFWDSYASGEPLGPWVAARRRVVDAAQRDTADGRVWLSGQFAALTELPGWGDLVDAATTSEPDRERCASLAAAMGATVTVDGSVTTLEWADTTSAVFDPALGGVRGPGEFTRWFHVVVRHAAWRDRPVRRLHTVRIDAEELWPLVKLGP